MTENYIKKTDWGSQENISPYLDIFLVGIRYPFNIFSEKIARPITDAFNPSAYRFWSSRIRIWTIQYAWEGFKEHPLLGIGYSNYIFYSGYRFYPEVYGTAMNFPEVNNYPMKVLSEMGIIGFIVLLWLFVKIIRSTVSSIKSEKNRSTQTIMISFLISFIALSSQMLFYSYITLAYLWFMLAMMLSLTVKYKVNLLTKRIGNYGSKY